MTAQIFRLKTRARWRESPTELRHSGSIGRKEMCEYSDDELMAIIREGVAEHGLAALKTITVEPEHPAPPATPRLVYPAR